MALALQSDGTTETTDPRILRSRRMLMEALDRLLNKKEFDDISVQEIADEATLNRATFYLHYPDKNALLQAMTAARFSDLIARRGLSFTNCDGALRAIALGVCDYLAESDGLPRPVGEDGSRRLHHPGRRGHVRARRCQSRVGARRRFRTAGDYGRLGHLRRRAPVAPDTRPHSR